MNNCNTSSINFNVLARFLNLLQSSSSSTLKACSNLHFVNWGRLQDHLWEIFLTDSLISISINNLFSIKEVNLILIHTTMQLNPKYDDSVTSSGYSSTALTLAQTYSFRLVICTLLLCFPWIISVSELGKGESLDGVEIQCKTFFITKSKIRNKDLQYCIMCWQLKHFSLYIYIYDWGGYS
jgi:hypothetical protein